MLNFSHLKNINRIISGKLIEDSTLSSFPLFLKFKTELAHCPVTLYNDIVISVTEVSANDKENGKEIMSETSPWKLFDVK